MSANGNAVNMDSAVLIGGAESVNAAILGQHFGLCHIGKTVMPTHSVIMLDYDVRFHLVSLLSAAGRQHPVRTNPLWHLKNSAREGHPMACSVVRCSPVEQP